jgi:hypothetical protein
LPPLTGDAWVTTLALPNGGEAHVGVPLGATRRLPIVVGVHGAGARPDWSCSEWLATTGGAAFIVCPHGSVDPRWAGTRVWGSGAAIAAESARAVRALRERYGAYLADGPLVYASWSWGSSLAADAIDAANGAAADGGAADLSFDRAILVEAGHTALDAKLVTRTLSARGVSRVVVSCSSAKCRAFAKDAQAAAKRIDLPLHVVDVGDRGHWFDEPVFKAIGAELPWLTEGDERWQRPAAPGG